MEREAQLEMQDACFAEGSAKSSRPVSTLTRANTFSSRGTGRLGIFTRTLLSRGESGDCDMSPNSKSNLINPLRSQLGLEPLKFSWNEPSPQVEEAKTNGKGDTFPTDIQHLDTSPQEYSSTCNSNEQNILFKSKLGLEPTKLTSWNEPSMQDKKFQAIGKNNIRSTGLLRSEKRSESHNTAYTRNEQAIVLKSQLGLEQAKFYKPSAQERKTKTSDKVSTETPLRKTSQELNLTYNCNEQNIAPKSGPIQGIAAIISTNNMKSRATPNASASTISSAESSSSTGNKLNNKSGTGPLRSLNPLVCDPGTPLTHPPIPAQESNRKKSVKKNGGSGWKFSNDTVSGKEYLILKELGRGGCGQVFLVMEKESRNLFAMKRINMASLDPGSIQECVNEVTMLRELKDSEFVIHIDSWEMNRNDNSMRIIMEYGICDLNKSLQSSRVSLLKLKFIWEQLLQIVEVIHSRGIVHADLKPANFVWVGDNLKIIDFGISNRLQTDHTSIAMLNAKGTLNFISPESIRPDAFGKTKIGPKSDIWSLGCILYLMVYGKTPFQDITNQATKMSAILAGVNSYPSLPPLLRHSSVISVLKLCFELDSRKRPTASELLKNQLFEESLLRYRYV